MLKDKNVVLAIGAHPDDIELGCGGALAKHIALGDSVYCLIMTNGEKGKHSAGKEECLASLNALGLKEVFFGNFADGFLSDDQTTVNFIETFINKFGVTRVYTHSPNDRHQDHRNCSHAVSSAARRIKDILLFQGPSTISFEPHYFVELSDSNFARKIEALSCYGSQLSKGTINPNLTRNIAELHGAMCNKKYAEAFAVNHLFREESDV
ncbi:MAG: PIG-L deacetylase family protein [archaeon]